MRQRIGAVVLAAGKGSRMSSSLPKQFLEINGRPLLYYSLRAFERAADEIVLVTGENWVSYCIEEIVSKYGLKKVRAVVPGGKERYDSVSCGLEALGDCEIILIHDGARPCVTEQVIRRGADGAEKYGACVVGMAVKDTIKVAEEKGFAASSPDRSRLWMIQTPQAFQGSLIREAYKRLTEADEDRKRKITDDAMVVETFLHHPVRLIEGDYRNLKVTTDEDLPVVQAYLKEERAGKENG